MNKKHKMKLSVVVVIFTMNLSSSTENYRYNEPPWCTKNHRNINVVGREILLNGKSIHILSGSLHYFRLPAQYWRDRLRKMKAAGLNAVSTYVEWSYHEPEERQYQFTGDRDVARFVRIAAEEGLLVLLRPGPYICAERDLGGLPYWLFSKHPLIRVRSADKDFIYETEIWMNRLFILVKSLLFGKGGPIILVQVENEYGSYGDDENYMKIIRDIIRYYVGNDALLYTSDAPENIKFGRVDGTLAAINLASSEMLDFDIISKNIKGPLFYAEVYTGWFTSWGSISDPADVSLNGTLHKLLLESRKVPIHINLYMFSGGTNFEFSSGASYDTDIYSPITTSYDYFAPLTEAGDLTPKYYTIRKMLAQYYPEIKKYHDMFKSRKGAYGSFVVRPCVSLLYPDGRARLGKWYYDVTGAVLPNFEQLRQRAGLLLYETTLIHSNGTLYIQESRDRVYVYVDCKLQGIIDSMKNDTELFLTSRAGSRLSLLVENLGRTSVTFYPNQLKDFKGILSPVEYKDNVLNGKWFVTGFPLRYMYIPFCSKHISVHDLSRGPILYKTFFTLPPEEPLDTFFYPAGWGKGYVWINGHNLGRYWQCLGPQQSLYVPAVWLHAAPAHNKLHILELEQAPANLTVMFVDHPVTI